MHLAMVGIEKRSLRDDKILNGNRAANGLVSALSVKKYRRLVFLNNNYCFVYDVL